MCVQSIQRQRGVGVLRVACGDQSCHERAKHKQCPFVSLVARDRYAYRTHDYRSSNVSATSSIAPLIRPHSKAIRLIQGVINQLPNVLARLTFVFVLRASAHLRAFTICYASSLINDRRGHHASSMTGQVRHKDDAKGPIELKLEAPHRQLAFDECEIRPSLKRYVILFLFCLNAGNKAFQWIQIPAGTDKFAHFYDVENFVINSTSVLFMLAFVVLSLPSCFIIERIGLRNAVLLGSGGTALGAVIKCFCCRTDSVGIALMFVGQTVVSLSEQLIFSVPSRLISVWFPDHQVSSAMAITVLGNQFGVALGFELTMLVMDGAETRAQIGVAMYKMWLVTAAVSVLAFVANLWLFDEAPKHAPGAARLQQIRVERERELIPLDAAHRVSVAEQTRELLANVTELLKNKNLVRLSMVYGINLGIGYTIQTLLNQMLAPLWPGDALFVGNTGFIIIVSGALSCPLWGWLLDSLRRYLLLNLLITLSTIVTLVLFGYVVSFTHLEWAVYLAAGVFGFFQTGFVVAGLEMAVELTYPADELITSTSMNLVPQIYGAVFIFLTSYLVDEHGAVAANAFMTACLCVALCVLLNTRETLARQQAVAKGEANRAACGPAGAVAALGASGRMSSMRRWRNAPDNLSTRSAVRNNASAASPPPPPPPPTALQPDGFVEIDIR